MPTTINIWNGAAQPDGSYVNAQNLANTLSFSPLSLLASNDINVLDNVNVSNGIFGLTTNNMTWIAPTINVNYNVTTGTGGLALNATTVNLTGDIFNYSTSSQLMDATHLTGTATTVNVLNNGANLQQALDLTSSSAGLSTINASFGNASSLAFDYDTSMILSGGQLSGNVTMNNTAAQLNLHGHAFEINTGTGFSPFGSGSIAAASGQLRGYLDSGDAFTVAFTQAATGQITTFDSAPLATVPLPSAVWLFSFGLMGLVGLARRKKK